MDQKGRKNGRGYRLTGIDRYVEHELPREIQYTAALRAPPSLSRQSPDQFREKQHYIALHSIEVAEARFIGEQGLFRLPTFLPSFDICEPKNAQRSFSKAYSKQGVFFSSRLKVFSSFSTLVNFREQGFEHGSLSHEFLFTPPWP